MASNSSYAYRTMRPEIDLIEDLPAGSHKGSIMPLPKTSNSYGGDPIVRYLRRVDARSEL